MIKPSIDSFNKVANGEMEIELYFADQLVPTGELFRAMQRGTIDAVQSDDDSIAAPVDISVFGGYFPFATRYSLDVPALFHQWGLNEIWAEAYGEIEGVTWLSAGAWDPCHFNTVNPIRSLEDLKGLRVFTFPTAGRFLSRFGVVPVTLPWEDIEVAVQTGELDGIAWSGITEDYTVGWADVTNYFLTNNISGAWCGSYFANSGKWDALPAHLQELFRLCMDRLALLPPVLVLGRRGEAAGGRHQAGTDLYSGRGMGDGGGRGGQVLGRDRGRDAAHRQGGRHPESVQRGHGQGRTPLSLHLSGGRPRPRDARPTRGTPHAPRPGVRSGPRALEWEEKLLPAWRDVSGWHTGPGRLQSRTGTRSRPTGRLESTPREFTNSSSTANGTSPKNRAAG